MSLIFQKPKCKKKNTEYLAFLLDKYISQSATYHLETYWITQQDAKCLFIAVYVTA